jgi:hypothetical protein
MRQAEEFYRLAAELGLDHDDLSLGTLR